MEKEAREKFISETQIDKWQEIIRLPVVKKENHEWKIEELEEKLSNSVKKCLGEVEKKDVAISLSGGLDSSLIAALARKDFPKARLVTITLGSKNNPDLLAAEKVAKILKTEHHEFITSIEEINQAKVEMTRKEIPFQAIEQFLVFKFASSLEIKRTISAEGADELFGGYWWHQKPVPKYGRDQKETFENSWSKILQSHLSEYQETSKKCGVEVRFPFLQREVVEYASQIPLKDRSTPSTQRYPDQKERKKPLRTITLKYLPKEIVYRRKQGFPGALMPEAEKPQAK